MIELRKDRREALMSELTERAIRRENDISEDLCDVIAACLIEWERGPDMAHDAAEAILRLVYAYEYGSDA